MKSSLSIAIVIQYQNVCSNVVFGLQLQFRFNENDFAADDGMSSLHPGHAESFGLFQKSTSKGEGRRSTIQKYVLGYVENV
jgi:hypothetical protein